MAGYTELEAVNYVLVRANETPINNISTDSTAASTLAKDFLELERLAVLGEGLQFNTRTARFTPDVNGNIKFGKNVLAIDGYGPIDSLGDNSDNKYTLVNGNLFDMEEQSDVFTDTVNLRVFYDFEFEQIPRWVQFRIMTRVALSFMSQFSPDENQLRDMADIARTALIQCNAKELDSDNTDMVAKTPLGSVVRSRLYRRFGA